MAHVEYCGIDGTVSSFRFYEASVPEDNIKLERARQKKIDRAVWKKLNFKR